MKGTEHIMVFKTKNELGLISIKDTAIKTIAGHGIKGYIEAMEHLIENHGEE